MTPEEFEKEMQELYDNQGGNEEVFHVEADRLLCKLLKELGYEKGIEIFENADRWYQ